MIHQYPLVSCVMPTYGRPLYVPEAIKCFVWQDYPNKEIVIINDCEGQEYECDIPGVRIINTRERFKSLGDKRNYAISLAAGEIIAVWDDDDISLPWRLSHTVRDMQRFQTPFYRPSLFHAYWGSEEFHPNQTIPGWISHGPTAFTKKLWSDVNGYPAIDMGEDAQFFDRIHKHLSEDFLKYPISESDRWYVLRGVSEYKHMSIGGGRQPLDTASGKYNVLPREIADPVLKLGVDKAISEYGIHHPDIANTCSLDKPVLSICISLKDRSRLLYDDKILDLFPRCIRSLSDTAREIGTIEVVVADFESKDFPLSEWLWGAGYLKVKVVPMSGSFSRGKGLNAAVRAASSDSLLLFDADILISASSLRRGLEDIKTGAVRFPICRNLNDQNKAYSWRDYGKGIVFITREQFYQCGGVPEFESWGGEDDLIYERVKARYPIIRELDSGLRHQWHPEWSRHIHYRNTPRSDFHQAIGIPPEELVSETIAVFIGEHPFWETGDSCVELYKNGRMERLAIEGGEFEWIPQEKLILKWDKWPEEVLLWDCENARYQSQEKKFFLKQLENPGINSTSTSQVAYPAGRID